MIRLEDGACDPLALIAAQRLADAFGREPVPECGPEAVRTPHSTPSGPIDEFGQTDDDRERSRERFEAQFVHTTSPDEWQRLRQQVQTHRDQETKQ